MNIIKILIFIFYGIVLKLYDDCADNPKFGKCVGEFYIEQLKSLIIFFLALTGLYEPYYAVIAFILQLIVINDLDNSFWLSYFLCSILICLIIFNQLTYDLFTILLVVSQIPIAIIDITFFSEDYSYKKYIWRGIKAMSIKIMPMLALNRVDFGIKNKASSISTTPDIMLT